MTYAPDNPLIVQSDLSLLLEVASPRYAEARDALLAFAELVKSPEYIHTWRINRLSLWNAAAAGRSADEIVETLSRLSRYPLPSSIEPRVRSWMDAYGKLTLTRDGEWLRLEADDDNDLEEVRRLADVQDLFEPAPDGKALRVHPRQRGELKQALTAAGHPIQDLAGYTDGQALEMRLSHELPDGRTWSMRDYQREAVDAFHGGPLAGSGVIVLPCGAGKTIVGIAAMVRLGMRTLILCAGNTALRQWRREILRRTSLTEEDVGQYTSTIKQLRPVTLTTYQLLTWRRDPSSPPPHMGILSEAAWGLIIYDEVHLLPAPVFRESAELQARRRLGLTATLVREDGAEGDVFALVGPRRFDMPWKKLEEQGWIASARCIEVRVPLSDEDRRRYIAANKSDKYKIAVKNARKVAHLESLLKQHRDDSVLVLGTYIDQLEWIARRLRIPLISGKTPAVDREALYEQFRSGALKVLLLSRVGNASLDLPNASVAVQVAGTWGSRQEEAQRLGRILRPDPDGKPAYFYALITADSREQEFAERRQLFLAEQGYPYRIENVQ
ncbi:MAG: DNA repair helicase XPB [Myxococcota bacterium]